MTVGYIKLSALRGALTQFLWDKMASFRFLATILLVAVATEAIPLVSKDDIDDQQQPILHQDQHDVYDAQPELKGAVKAHNTTHGTHNVLNGTHTTGHKAHNGTHTTWHNTGHNGHNGTHTSGHNVQNGTHTTWHNTGHNGHNGTHTSGHNVHNGTHTTGHNVHNGTHTTWHNGHNGTHTSGHNVHNGTHTTWNNGHNGTHTSGHNVHNGTHTTWHNGHNGTQTAGHNTGHNVHNGTHSIGHNGHNGTHTAGHNTGHNTAQHVTSAPYNSPAVGFHVALTPDYLTIPHDETVVLDHSVVNIGGAYDVTHGHFTATVPGLYSFTANIEFRSSDTATLDFSIVKNGDSIGRVYVYGSGTSIRSVVVFLDIGDIVWLKNNVDNHPRLYGEGLSTFSGFLIAPVH